MSVIMDAHAEADSINQVDPFWYLIRYADVAELGADPHDHFTNFGFGEGRNARAPDESSFIDDLTILGTKELIFDSKWYVAKNPDIDFSSIDPMTHFNRYGEGEGRSPCRFFDPDWYKLVNPDVVSSGCTSLTHYVRWGAEELRDPSPDFHSAFYVYNNADADTNPLLHYMMVGRHNQLPTSFIIDYEDILPCLNSRYRSYPASNGIKQAPAVVVIPVYKGFEETKSCLKSVFEDPAFALNRIIIINDCSPDVLLNDWLAELKLPANVSLIQNEVNLGFVASTNLGIDEAGVSDVVLLNSDTIVPKNWVQRLQFHAYQNDSTATVSPVSNNATICSYPAMGNNRLPFGADAKSLDDALFSCNYGRSVVAPTTVGFCMYIKRSVLDAIGILDASTFGLGYGEEVDLCQRAIGAGFHNIIAWDIFVQHLGEISFGTQSSSRSLGEAALVERYPDFSRSVNIFARIDSALPFRFAITGQLFHSNNRETVLYISHSLGGGVERHIAFDAQLHRENLNIIVISPAGSNLQISFPLEPSHPPLTFDESKLIEIHKYLSHTNLKKIIVHHNIGYINSVFVILRHLRPIPYEVMVHDYYMVCPQINLIKIAGQRYCGEPSSNECNSCIAHRQHHQDSDIDFWRLRSGALINGADRVYFPSRDTYNRMAKYYDIPHGIIKTHDDYYRNECSALNVTTDKENFRVLVIGVLAEHKGASTVIEIARRLKESCITIHLVGYFDSDVAMSQEAEIILHGAYRASDVLGLIAKIRPHLIWFPARWPETYSYTLSEALASKLPIIAPAIGAFTERLIGRSLTWLFPYDAMNADLCQLILEAREEISHAARTRTGRVHRKSSDLAKRSILTDNNRQFAIDQGIITKRVHVLPESFENGVPTPCGYIRLVLPIRDIANDMGWTLSVGSLDTIDLVRPDILFLQRHSLLEIESAQRIVSQIQSRGGKIVYDLDDDLINVPDSHVCYNELNERRDIVQFLLSKADLVTVSTHKLAEIARLYRREVIILPNAIDSRLWLPEKRNPISFDGTVRVLYMGTSTHQEDWQMIEPAVERLINKHQTRIEFSVVGVTDRKLPDRVHRKIPDGRLGFSYPGFVHWLRQNNSWDIGLAPLTSSPFSDSKSDLKTMDYAGLGLCSIASRVPSYIDSIADCGGGLLVDNNENSWFDALDHAVQNQQWLQRTQEAAVEILLKEHTLAAQRISRTAIFKEYLFGVPAHPSRSQSS